MVAPFSPFVSKLARVVVLWFCKVLVNVSLRSSKQKVKVRNVPIVHAQFTCKHIKLHFSCTPKS